MILREPFTLIVVALFCLAVAYFVVEAPCAKDQAQPCLTQEKP